MARTRAAPVILAQQGDVIAERDPRRPSGRLLRQAGMDASYADLADSRHLEFDYLRWMWIVLRVAAARRVLHIGGGACALARALAAEDPTGRQQVCEVDRTVLAIAREHLGLRRAPGLRVRHAEGRAFIASQPHASWDAVVIDAYVGAAIPKALISPEALSDVAHVAPIALVNVLDDRAAREVRAVAGAMAAAFRHAWTLGAKAAGNTVVIGAATGLNLNRIAALAAADPSPARFVAIR